MPQADSLEIPRVAEQAVAAVSAEAHAKKTLVEQYPDFFAKLEQLNKALGGKLARVGETGLFTAITGTHESKGSLIIANPQPEEGKITALVNDGSPNDYEDRPERRNVAWISFNPTVDSMSEVESAITVAFVSQNQIDERGRHKIINRRLSSPQEISDIVIPVIERRLAHIVQEIKARPATLPDLWALAAKAFS